MVIVFSKYAQGGGEVDTMDIPLQFATIIGLIFIIIVLTQLWQHFFVVLPKKRRRQELLAALNALDETSPEWLPATPARQLLSGFLFA